MYPSTPPLVANDFPAAIGGAGNALVTATESQALTRASPNTDAPAASEMLSLANVSAYFAFVKAQAGATVSGGNLGIWRLDSTLNVWVYVLSIGLPTGQQYVGVTLDLSLLHDGSLFAATEAVTVSAGAAVDVYLRGR